MYKILSGILTLFICLTVSIAYAVGGTWNAGVTDTAKTGWINLSQVSQIDTISGTSNSQPKTGPCSTGEKWRYRQLQTYTMYTPARYFLVVKDQVCSQ